MEKTVNKMRNQYTFYKSYLDAIDELPDENQLEVYRAISYYAIRDEVVTGLSPAASIVFNLIKPALDLGRKKSEIAIRRQSNKKR